MLYLAYYDPFNPDIISIEVISDWHGNEGNTLAAIIQQGCIPRYSEHKSKRVSCTNSTIIAKSINLLVFESDIYLVSYNYTLVTAILADLWKQGKLHLFDFTNYPELLI